MVHPAIVYPLLVNNCQLQNPEVSEVILLRRIFCVQSSDVAPVNSPFTLLAASWVARFQHNPQNRRRKTRLFPQKRTNVLRKHNVAQIIGHTKHILFTLLSSYLTETQRIILNFHLSAVKDGNVSI